MKQHEKIVETFGQPFVTELAHRHGIAWPVVPEDNPSHGWVEADTEAHTQSEYTVTDVPVSDLDAGLRLLRILAEQHPDCLTWLRAGFAQVDGQTCFYIDLD